MSATYDRIELHGEIDRPDRVFLRGAVNIERPFSRQKIGTEILHRTNTKGMIQQTVGHSFISNRWFIFFPPIIMLCPFFATYLLIYRKSRKKNLRKLSNISLLLSSF